MRLLNEKNPKDIVMIDKNFHVGFNMGCLRDFIENKGGPMKIKAGVMSVLILISLANVQFEGSVDPSATGPFQYLVSAPYLLQCLFQ